MQRVKRSKHIFNFSFTVARTYLFTIYYISHRLGYSNGTPLQYSCLGNPMDGGAWQATVYEVTKSWTQLSDFTFTFMHWRRKWQPTPVFLPGESQGQRSLVSCCLWGRTESDMTDTTQQQQQDIYGSNDIDVTSTGRPPRGGRGNPLQYTCLENPMDRGAWRATVHGVAKSQRGLKWLCTQTIKGYQSTIHPSLVPFIMPMKTQRT